MAAASCKGKKVAKALLQKKEKSRAKAEKSKRPDCEPMVEEATPASKVRRTTSPDSLQQKGVAAVMKVKKKAMAAGKSIDAYINSCSRKQLKKRLAANANSDEDQLISLATMVQGLSHEGAPFSTKAIYPFPYSFILQVVFANVLTPHPHACRKMEAMMKGAQAPTNLLKRRFKAVPRPLSRMKKLGKLGKLGKRVPLRKGRRVRLSRSQATKTLRLRLQSQHLRRRPRAKQGQSRASLPGLPSTRRKRPRRPARKAPSQPTSPRRK